MVYLFLDTNIFLHFKPFQQIKWEIYTNSDYRLVIAPIIIHELDEHKYNQKAKIAKRAKQTLADFEKLMEIVDITAKIEFLLSRPDYTLFEKYQLNPMQQDDSLLLSMIEFQSLHPNDVLMLVTNDTGPKFKAKSFGISSLKLSEMDKLSDEVDENEKELARIQKELQGLKNLVPKVDLCIYNKERKHTYTIPTRFPDLELYQRHKLLLIRRLHPIIDDSEKDPYKNPIAGIQNYNRSILGVNKYFKEKYNKAVNQYYIDYEKYSRELYSYERNLNHSIRLQLQLINEGNTPAKDIDIKVIFPGNLLITEEKDFPPIPTEPVAPKMEHFNAVGLAVMPNLQLTSFEEMLRSTRPPILDKETPTIHPGQEITVTFHQEQLKHLQTKNLKLLNLQFNTIEEMKSFSISYLLNVSNITTAIKDQLNIILS